MKYDFHVHDVIRVEYRVQLDAAPRPGATCDIQTEARCAGGAGIWKAAALALWGAKVLLTGNRIGDDSHGRWLAHELAAFESLEEGALAWGGKLGAKVETPYVILLKWPGVAEAALQRAGDLRWTPVPVMDADVIVETDGVPAQWAIAGAAGQWARWQKWPASRISAFSSAASELFGARFGGLETIPGIAEIEAALK